MASQARSPTPTPPPAPAPAPAQDRRDGPRRLLRCEAHVRLGASKLHGNVLDLSTNGMGVVVASNLPPGTSLSVQFSVPDKHHGRHLVEVGAKVEYSVFSSKFDGFHLGLALVRVADADRAAIERFLHE
jgi:c-di-GMP-binding flagellar brake protein YcgR